MANSVLNKVKNNSKTNVKTTAKKPSSGVSIPLVSSVFQSTTTLSVGEHKTTLQDVEQGVSKSGSPKLTFKEG